MAQIVMGLWFGLLVLGLVFGRNAALDRAFWLTAEESLDHPSRGTRYWHRFWSWSFWYSVSMMLSLFVLAIPGGDGIAAAAFERVGPSLAFLYPIPLAAILFGLDRRLTLRGSRIKRQARRRMGLPGYRINPPQDPSAQLHVPFATSTSPGSRMSQSPLRSGQDKQVEAIDPRDPDLVREFARKHWEAINFALASGNGVDAAHQRRARFIGDLERQPGPETERALEIYYEESAIHAKSAAGIAAVQRERTEEQALVRARAARNLKVITWTVLSIALASLLLKTCMR